MKRITMITSTMLIFTVIIFNSSYLLADASVGVTPDQISYKNAEEFEFALNSGVDVNEEIVQFEVNKYVPDSILGINCWAGEHLNFISSEELEVKQGNIIVGQVTKRPKKTIFGSWKIYYDVLQIFYSDVVAQNEESESESETMPTLESASFYIGTQLEDVVSQLDYMGFTNISTQAVYDLYFSTAKQGKVASISINGITDFNTADFFDPDSQIIITYHMYYKDDPELRTYRGVVYDKAFTCSGADGLRAKFLCVYLFDDSEHTVRYIMKTTVGGLKTRQKTGSYEGNFDEEITIKWEDSDWESAAVEAVFVRSNSDNGDCWYDGARTYSETDVESAINRLEYW